MSSDEPITIAVQFNQCINRRDIDGLALLMTNDHTFIDSANHAIHGREKTLRAWENFFKLFPDYQNIFDRVILQNGLVTITGHSTCSDQRLTGPAIWTAKLKDHTVAEWRVYDDTLETRSQLGIPMENRTARGAV